MFYYEGHQPHKGFLLTLVLFPNLINMAPISFSKPLSKCWTAKAKSITLSPRGQFQFPNKYSDF